MMSETEWPVKIDFRVFENPVETELGLMKDKSVIGKKNRLGFAF